MDRQFSNTKKQPQTCHPTLQIFLKTVIKKRRFLRHVLDSNER